DGVAFLRDDAFDEGLLRIERVIQHDDVAATRLADPVDQLVDDQAILILERRRHAEALHARHLEQERDDEDGVHSGRHEGLQPRDELFLHLREADARTRGWRRDDWTGIAVDLARLKPSRSISI